MQAVPREDVSASKSYELRIGQQGRIVLPAPIRHALALKPGEPLTCRFERGQLIIESRRAAIRRLQDMCAAIKGSMSRELIRERRREARREAKD